MPKHRICIAFSEINTHQGNDRGTGIYKLAHITMPSRDGIKKNLSDGCLLLELMTLRSYT